MAHTKEELQDMKNLAELLKSDNASLRILVGKLEDIGKMIPEDLKKHFDRLYWPLRKQLTAWEVEKKELEKRYKGKNYVACLEEFIGVEAKAVVEILSTKPAVDAPRLSTIKKDPGV